MISSLLYLCSAFLMVTAIDCLSSPARVVKGYHIYSMAESLALSIVPSKVALVGIANIKYAKKILKGEVIYAKAEVKKKRDTNYIVWVKIYGKDNDVRFKGKFLLKGIE